MLRHFLNPTARMSTRSLFVKPNPPCSGGLNFFSSTAHTSSRSLFTKCNTPSLASYSLRSNVHTNSRPLLVKSNATVYLSSLRSLSGQQESRADRLMRTVGGWFTWLLRYSRRAPVRALLMMTVLGTALVYGPLLALAWCSAWCAAHVQNTAILALHEQDEGESGLMSNWIAFRSYLRECAKAKSEFKAYNGYRMTHHILFCPKAFVKPELMPKFKEILDEFKSRGIRVQKSKNYYFVYADDGWKRERFFEQIMKLGGASEPECGVGGGGYAREEYSWSGSNAASNKNAVASRTYRSY